MDRKQQSRHARSSSCAGGAGSALASFLRSTAASFSTSTSFSTTSSTRASGNKKKPSFNHRNAFSGPIMVSIVPPEARGRRSRGSRRGGYRTPEPSSPKVSCIGQIKKSKSKPRKVKVKPCCGEDGGACPLPPRPPVPKGSSLVRRMFFRRSRSRSSSSNSSGTTTATDGFKGRGSNAAVAAAPRAGGLGQMKRFTSGRAAFQDFDWRDQAEKRFGSDDDDEEDYEDDGFVAHSAPLVLGGGMVASEPRKEVNLWRRRPMSPPTPLELP